MYAGLLVSHLGDWALTEIHKPAIAPRFISLFSTQVNTFASISISEFSTLGSKTHET